MVYVNNELKARAQFAALFIKVAETLEAPRIRAIVDYGLEEEPITPTAIDNVMCPMITDGTTRKVWKVRK